MRSALSAGRSRVDGGGGSENVPDLTAAQAALGQAADRARDGGGGGSKEWAGAGRPGKQNRKARALP